MKLYEAVLSSAAFRVRIALNLKGLAYESEVFDLRAKQHLTDEYRRLARKLVRSRGRPEPFNESDWGFAAEELPTAYPE